LNTQNPIPFYDMFPFIKEKNRLSADYAGAFVVSVYINQPKTVMEIALTVSEPAPPYEISIIEDMISGEYGIKSVTVIAASSRPPVSNTQKQENSFSGKTASKASTSSKVRPASAVAIMGRVTKTKPVPMGEVTIDHGKVTIKGKVFANRSRFIEKSNSWLINFDVTDYTGSINVTKFMRDEKAGNVAKAIKAGMHLVVSGSLGINKYDNELTLDPQNIFPYENEPRADNAEKKRIELHLHTKMSAMDALTDIGEAIDRAVLWGHPAIAITDHGVAHSFPSAARAASKYKNKIKVIYGLEGYFRNDIDKKEKKERRRRSNHIILLVKNQVGLKNLYKLITSSHLENYDGRPIIYKSQLESHREGLIIGSACEAGEVFRAILNNAQSAELEKIASFYDYLEIMPVCNNYFMLYSNPPKAKSEEELRGFNEKIVELGRTLGKPVVATGDVHFLDPEHEVYRKILQTSRGFSDISDELPLYYKSTDEMLREFSYLGEGTARDVVINNPQLIAEMCENVSPLPTGGKLYPPKLEGSAIDLKCLVQSRAAELYGTPPPSIVTKRIDYELHDILRLNYDVIYMAAQKLVSYLKTQKSRVGSRGSIGSSLVAYLAGITEVCPLPAHYRCPECKHTEFHADNTQVAGDDSLPSFLPYACGADMPDKLCTACGAMHTKDGFNIPFETFMGFDGEKVPDIDLNISSEHLAQAHKFTSNMFGSDYVFRAGTIGTVKDANAYKFMKKYLDAIGRSATRAEENRLAHGCLGVKQTTGQHPGGLIVIPQDMEITDFCPAQYPADDKEQSVITLHFEYKYIEDNLIKLDILGHDNPTMLRMLENMTGVDADDIHLDDPETMSIFSSPAALGLPEDDKIIGETGSIGIPEFGTVFTRQMLCDTRPKDFDTLVRLSGFSHGESVWAGNAKELISAGKATINETISSRDDIMLFLISKGMNDRYAFKISESVRKGKGIPDGSEDEMLRQNVPKWFIDSCKKIKYLFPKAHAVAYVIMAFRIAWFKVHKPLVFYSAHFYRRRKSFDVELMTRGIDIVRNKIRELQSNTDPKTGKEEGLLTTLESCYEFYLRGFDFAGVDLYYSDAEMFLITDDNKLRPPFIAISGLGETAAQDLALQRQSRSFISIDDISSACPSVNKSNLDSLKALGALRELPDSSQMSLF